ncbi:uncharacterized protein MYCFIDRAFT_172842 [Pseudocercospora fijiensis CIRAD86]|uniref:Uncharacterized protein n=1 Tax=Pseudocercospora fijiensis (strain CIRAD86) TaxID=383855 RepID=M3AGU7_PSEFD|nr:uncharacterized protein MYCFIDRAFT_172842 [Pseudocercospora fijiensis CIRAD86]EME83766.1 hypothetical protein MYCFIDRAFT_172842 [Pseudocercospora fijiensis CIRAD86]
MAGSTLSDSPCKLFHVIDLFDYSAGTGVRSVLIVVHNMQLQNFIRFLAFVPASIPIVSHKNIVGYPFPSAGLPNLPDKCQQASTRQLSRNAWTSGNICWNYISRIIMSRKVSEGDQLTPHQQSTWQHAITKNILCHHLHCDTESWKRQSLPTSSSQPRSPPTTPQNIIPPQALQLGRRYDFDQPADQIRGARKATYFFDESSKQPPKPRYQKQSSSISSEPE